MKHRGPRRVILSFFLAMVIGATFLGVSTQAQELEFDHNHTHSEVVAYLQKVAETYPTLTKLHNIGKSYLGKDLLVLEITNQGKGGASEKPAYWLDGNIHAGEVFGAEICLKTIGTLVTQHGNDPFVTNLVDSRTIYIMPKLNPDGSDHFLTKPDGMRSSVRPHDADGDGLLDEDPGEDLNGDRNLTRMRIRDEMGEWKTSPEDPRLMIRRKEDEKGEWRVYSEGIDNDNDGRFNEDGVGGLDINRNFPSQWQPEWVQRGSGRYPLSEPETRAVADFLLAHRHVAGFQDIHMSGNFLFRPPCNLRLNPLTGEKDPFPPEDEAVYRVFADKYAEIINNQEVRVAYNPPSVRFGVMIDWAIDNYGVHSFAPEVGSYQPFCDYDEDGTATEVERLRWNDTEMGGKVFVDWEPYEHPQLGQVEIGGFIRKIYDPTYKTYINLMCHPGPVYEDFLDKHTKWNLYLMSMTPLVRITDAKVVPKESGFFQIVANIQNQGYLPTNVTQLAVRNGTAKTVKATITLTGATLVTGKEKIDIGHLPGNTPRSSSPVKKVEWLVKADGREPTVVVKAVSEKGGTDSKELAVKR
jgi:hypothetical protein